MGRSRLLHQLSVTLLALHCSTASLSLGYRPLKLQKERKTPLLAVDKNPSFQSN